MLLFIYTSLLLSLHACIYVSNYTSLSSFWSSRPVQTSQGMTVGPTNPSGYTAQRGSPKAPGDALSPPNKVPGIPTAQLSSCGFWGAQGQRRAGTSLPPTPLLPSLSAPVFVYHFLCQGNVSQVILCFHPSKTRII